MSKLSHSNPNLDNVLGQESFQVKACPFCGSVADTDYDHKVNMSRYYDGKVYCTSCEHVSTGWVKGKTQDEAIENAIKIWNTRTLVDQQPVVLPLHTRSCSAAWRNSEECTCGLEWRIKLQTEQEMHNAWRKRAEEAEAELAMLKRESAHPDETTKTAVFNAITRLTNAAPEASPLNRLLISHRLALAETAIAAMPMRESPQPVGLPVDDLNLPCKDGCGATPEWPRHTWVCPSGHALFTPPEREAQQAADTSPLRKNICRVLDTVPKYYQAEVGDRISNIFDIADAIMAEVDRARQPMRESGTLADSDISEAVHELLVGYDLLAAKTMGGKATAVLFCMQAAFARLIQHFDIRRRG